ncbi:hypothetical protein ACIHFD_04455 [Nonomuraea sp. NPDC051941]|uniref:hypothetical protein n=1 Tax=Nonomuraea sp. NPDC051941 TaxID=3364373 RepID=UPI0037C97C4C
MADGTPTSAVPLQLIEGDADGYCDPVTGVCVLPTGTAAGLTSEKRPPDEPGGSDQ